MRYELIGVCQTAQQWDGSDYQVKNGTIVTLVKKRIIADDLYRVERDGRIIAIPESIIERYFEDLDKRIMASLSEAKKLY